MSIKLMSQVWDSGPENQSELLVLLVLADFANDSGACWPSMRRVAEKARIQERSAIRVLRRLEVAGYVKTETGGGRGGCNKYRINPDPQSPLTESHPDPRSPETLTLEAINPDPPVTRTIIEPPLEPSEDKKTPVDVLCEIVRHETAVDFASHRKALKKPLTMEAAKRLVSKLAGHPDPDAVFDISIENGWQGVFPEKTTGGGYDPRNLNRTSNGHQDRPDPALEQIARLTGIG